MQTSLAGTPARYGDMVMLNDPFANLMVVILIFFVGLLIFFVLIMRSLDSSRRNHDEASRQISLSLSDLEHKITELDHSVQQLMGTRGVPGGIQPATREAFMAGPMDLETVPAGENLSLASGSLTNLLRQMGKDGATPQPSSTVAAEETAKDRIL